MNFFKNRGCLIVEAFVPGFRSGSFLAEPTFCIQHIPVCSGSVNTVDFVHPQLIESGRHKCKFFRKWIGCLPLKCIHWWTQNSNRVRMFWDLVSSSIPSIFEEGTFMNQNNNIDLYFNFMNYIMTSFIINYFVNQHLYPWGNTINLWWKHFPQINSFGRGSENAVLYCGELSCLNFIPSMNFWYSIGEVRRFVTHRYAPGDLWIHRFHNCRVERAVFQLLESWNSPRCA